MERIGEEVHITTTEASGGVTHHGVRYMLLFSLGMAIVLLSLIWITGSYLSGEKTEKPFRYEGAAAETG